MDIPYTSEHFYHFVGRRNPEAHEENFSTLCRILSDREVRHRPFTPGGGTNAITIPKQVRIFSEELLVPTVTCFSDIPATSLQVHIEKYGPFGLSLSRTHLIEWGTRPVLYWPFILNDGRFDNHALKDIWTTYIYFRELVVERRQGKFSDTRAIGVRPSSEDEAIDAFVSSVQKNLLPYIKPFDARRPPHALESFYMEREWRHFSYMAFMPNDIGEIVVAAGFQERMLQAFPEYEGRVREQVVVLPEHT